MILVNDLESKEYTYSNLLIKRIKRMIDKCEIDHRDFSESEIVCIALNVLRIMTEIPFGDGTEDVHEWQLFFDAQKSYKEFMHFIHHLERMSMVKNTLLNEIIERTDIEDLEQLIREEKGAIPESKGDDNDGI